MQSFSKALKPTSPTQNVYALLVGIDDYLPPVPPLNGCINDVMAMEEYLTERIRQNKFKLHLRKLIDQQATRQSIINEFRHHLGQATENDIALFYYAGHGSQQPTPPELRHLEPDGLNETLVCWDSRIEGGWDLADKELAKLIAEVSQANPHLLIITDCCHSGHINRNFNQQKIPSVWERGIAPDYRQRPIESFIFSPEEVSALKTVQSADHVYRGERNLEVAPSPDFLKGRHILLAACRDQETAKEFRASEKPRGIFSHFLLKTLQNANNQLTYRDLFKQTEANVSSSVAQQSPQIEATDFADLNQPFLGGAITEPPIYFTVKRIQQDWVMDGGAVHGISQPVNDEFALVALFANTNELSHQQQNSAAITTAKIMQVLPQLSRLEIETEELLQPDQTYRAIITSLPLPRFEVFLDGDPNGILQVRQALNQANHGKPSLYVRETQEPSPTTFRLQVQPHPYVLMRLNDDRPVVLPGASHILPDPNQMVQQLEHIARWQSIANLSSPPTSRISSDAIQVEIYQGDRPIATAAKLDTLPLRLEYQYVNGQWQAPMFRIKLTNTGEEPLYCALLDLTEQFSIVANLLRGGGAWLSPGQWVWSLDGEPLCGLLPKELLAQGITEYKDILQLIACTAAFDAMLLEQPKLNAAQTRTTKLLSNRIGTLSRLMNRAVMRDLCVQPTLTEPCDDWITKQMVCTIVGPVSNF